MSRKSFLSTDFFVPASEADAKKILLSLPGHFSQLTLLKEDTVVHSTRFLFQNPEKETQFYVDVTILQLDDQYVRFSLHGSYTNGQPVQNETDIRNMLNQFEKSIHAAMNNDFSSLQTESAKPVATKKAFPFLESVLALFISKYHY